MNEKKLLLLIAILCAGCLLFLSAFAETDQPELKFSHKKHVVENELECITCHAAAEESVTGVDDLLPTMEVCSNCHDVESDESCAMCHNDLENPRAVKRVDKYNEKFSHGKHLASGLECTACHQEVAQKTMVEPYILPKMAACMDCHRARQVSTECSGCHKAGEILKPVSHSPDFIHTHSDASRRSASAMQTGQTCQLCHSTRFCQECHEGDNLNRLTHPLNYAFTHSLDAMGKERDCAVCHTDRSFCLDCHRDNLVMPHSHTAGWVNRIPQDGGRHATEAASDLENCMTCHEQNAQQICETCHSK